MSVRVSALVWESSVPAPARFTLLALADRADEDGRCWPSIPTLVSKLRMGESTIRGHLRSLERIGVISTATRSGTSSMYVINLPLLHAQAAANLAAHPAEIRPPSGSGPPQDLAPSPSGSEGVPPQDLAPTPPDPGGDPPRIWPQSITDPSLIRQVDTSLIRQERARRRAATPATRIPDDFAVTPEMVEWAKRETPGMDVRRITAAFVDYWRAKPGAAGRKLDWVATWRTWMRREYERQSEKPQNRNRNGRRNADEKIAQLQAMKTARPALPGGG